MGPRRILTLCKRVSRVRSRVADESTAEIPDEAGSERLAQALLGGPRGSRRITNMPNTREYHLRDHHRLLGGLRIRISRSA
jgi:hypothetical protein